MRQTILIIALFLIFFSLPKEVNADFTPSCSGPYIWKAEFRCCFTNTGDNDACVGDQYIVCAGGTYDSTSGVCKSSSDEPATDPACPLGNWVTFPTPVQGICTVKGQNLSKYCCRGTNPILLSGLTGGLCDSKNGIQLVDPRSSSYCDQYLEAVKEYTLKNYCGSDGTRYFDPNIGKCVKVKDWISTAWSKIITKCNGVDGIETAIGCVPTEKLQPLLEFILRWTLFASGGIIVLMTIATGYTILTSQGNPEKLGAAKENIVALLSGFLLIAFSLILLQTIGANILHLPTF